MESIIRCSRPVKIFKGFFFLIQAKRERSFLVPKQCVVGFTLNKPIEGFDSTVVLVHEVKAQCKLVDRSVVQSLVEFTQLQDGFSGMLIGSLRQMCINNLL